MEDKNIAKYFGTWNNELVIDYEQIASIWGIPANRLRKRFSDHPECFHDNINTYWLDAKEIAAYREKNGYACSHINPKAKNLRLFNADGYDILINGIKGVKNTNNKSTAQKKRQPEKPAIKEEQPVLQESKANSSMDDPYFKLGQILSEQIRTLVGEAIQFETDNVKQDYCKMGERLNKSREFCDDVTKHINEMDTVILQTVKKVDDIQANIKDAFSVAKLQADAKSLQQLAKMEERIKHLEAKIGAAVETLPPSNIDESQDLDSTAVAKKFGWYTERMTPHYRLVGAICKECGVVVNYTLHKDSEDVKYRKFQSGDQDIYYQPLFTPRAQQKIKEHWDATHLQRYVSETYKTTCRGGKKGSLKDFGYYYGVGKGSKYKVYDKHCHPLVPATETSRIA